MKKWEEEGREEVGVVWAVAWEGRELLISRENLMRGSNKSLIKMKQNSGKLEKQGDNAYKFNFLSHKFMFIVI